MTLQKHIFLNHLEIILLLWKLPCKNYQFLKLFKTHFPQLCPAGIKTLVQRVTILDTSTGTRKRDENTPNEN